MFSFGLSKPPIIKKVVDLSVEVKSLGTPMFPVFPQPLRTALANVRDDGYQANVWTLAEHTGTHVDAPIHFHEGGLAIDQTDVASYVCHGVVLDLSNRPPKYAIRRDDVVNALNLSGKTDAVGPGWVLLLHTGYGAKSGSEWLEYPGLSQEACDFIASLKVSAIGSDSPSPDHEPYPAHATLLPKGIWLYEGLNNLEKLLRTEFIFVGTPLKLVGGTASPVRAIAIIIE